MFLSIGKSLGIFSILMNSFNVIFIHSLMIEKYEGDQVTMTVLSIIHIRTVQNLPMFGQTQFCSSRQFFLCCLPDSMEESLTLLDLCMRMQTEMHEEVVPRTFVKKQCYDLLKEERDLLLENGQLFSDSPLLLV